MRRYGDWLASGFRAKGWTVEALRPSPFLGKLKPSASGLGKYLGYIDKYVLFPRRLNKIFRSGHFDIACLPDHSHAMYLRNLRKMPAVVHCHDLFAIRAALGKIDHQPTRFSGRIYQRWIAKSLFQARYVCCVSKQTCTEFQETFPNFSGQLTVTPNGRNYPYSPMTGEEAQRKLEEFRNERELSKSPFILHVGGNQWYKNRNGLVKSFAQFCSNGENNLHLWLVGKAPSESLRKTITATGYANRIHCIEAVSNDELELLYNTCEFFCFLSISEGFGWPVTEAQACGAAVLACDKDPMREVGGKAAYYAPALSEDHELPNEWYAQVAGRMREILDRSESQKAQDRKAALQQAAKYEPDKCFEGIFNFYQQTLSGLSTAE